MANVAVVVLTGLRPHLLTRTVDGMRVNAPALWEDAVRVVVHNGGDRETADVLDRYSWDVRHAVDGPLLGIAAASQVLADVTPDVDLVLRLEDDFECVQPEQVWMPDAVALLEDRKVGQVRLRDATEKVLRQDRVTGTPIRWQPHGRHKVGLAHYTHQPSLMRHADWKALFPYTDEVDAARRFRSTGLKTVQHVPGGFRHLAGRDESLKWNGGSA